MSPKRSTTCCRAQPVTRSMFAIVYGSRHADDADIAFTDFARAFELHPQFGRRNVSGSGYADGALVVLLVAALAHVDVAPEEMFVERVSPLVHRMACDRSDRAALLGQQSSDLDIIHRDLAEHRFLAGIGLSAERGAFEHLAVEIGEPVWKAAPDGRRGKDRTIAAAAADDHVGALV